MSIDRELFRVMCFGCGNVGELQMTSNDWGRLTARWSGFVPLRTVLCRPEQSAARCGRCGGRDTRVGAVAATAGRGSRWCTPCALGAFTATDPRGKPDKARAAVRRRASSLFLLLVGAPVHLSPLA
jgi:hypothetical protein